MQLPIEIVGLNKPEVRFVWDDEHASVFPARDLRIACGCAYCVEEMTGRPLLDPATVPADLTVTDMELVGSYGVRVTFSDRHATGIYRFRQLRERCPCSACRPPAGP